MKEYVNCVNKIFDANICTKIIESFLAIVKFFVRECPNTGVCGNAISNPDSLLLNAPL